MVLIPWRDNPDVINGAKSDFGYYPERCTDCKYPLDDCACPRCEVCEKLLDDCECEEEE